VKGGGYPERSFYEKRTTPVKLSRFRHRRYAIYWSNTKLIMVNTQRNERQKKKELFPHAW
jgi:hypothetical protein